MESVQKQTQDPQPQDRWIIGNYEFDNPKDARQAEKEQQNIDALKAKIDFTNLADMQELYTRLVKRNVFHTPVGYQFLSEFREYLEEQLKSEHLSLPCVPINGCSGVDLSQSNIVKNLNAELQTLRVRQKRHYIIIGGCIVLIIAMFAVAVLNPNTGYINAENKVLNKYASWEESLNQREAVIRAKEQELGIPSPVLDETEE